jgi:antitoxin component YwqK of YwqJK toxin-antitoxin module
VGPHGTRTGKKSAEFTLKDDKLISEKNWDRDGNPLGQDQGGEVPKSEVEVPKPAVEAPKVVVDWDHLEERDGLDYFEGKPFTGVAVMKWPNGKKDAEANYRDGKWHGMVARWQRNGQKLREGNWKDGKLMTATVWKHNGEKCPVTNVVDGNGISCDYHDNGQKWIEITYKDGEKHGLENVWYRNGQKMAEETRKDGKLHGLYTTWYENGQKSAEGTWKDGKRISYKAWDRDGNLTKELP